MVLLLAACLGLAAPAQAATNIECLDTGYSQAQLATFAEFRRSYNPSVEQGSGSVDTIMPAIISRASTCFLANGWSEAVLTQALFYKLGGEMEQAIAFKLAFNPKQKAALESLLTSDASPIRKVIMPIAEAQVREELAPEITAEQEDEMGAAIMVLDLPSDQRTAELIGGLAAARFMREAALARFKTL